MRFPAQSVKVPGMIGLNLRTIFCFGRQEDMQRYGELYGFSYRTRNEIRHINLDGPVLIKVCGIGSVMGYERMNTGFILLSSSTRVLDREEIEALQICRERYMNLGEYYVP